MSVYTGDELTQSDLQARRLLDIVLTLLGSPGPVSSSRLRELHYPGIQPDSFRKVFSRDRQRLALCGITIQRTNRPPDEPLWTIDQERSFSSTDVLDAREAVVLDVACSQLLSDPSFPFANDLRSALAKIDRLFDRDYPQVGELPLARHDRRLSTLESCLLSHHAADVQYKRLDGKISQRCLAPYGMFSLRGQAYVVGPSVSTDGTPEPTTLRTYRTDRITKIHECRGITYVIPKDFSINDYVLLPFQVGPPLYYADFKPMQDNTDTKHLRSICNADVVSDEHGDTVLRLSVSNEARAAAWAIETGLIPQQPQSLVAIWKKILKETLDATRR